MRKRRNRKEVEWFMEYDGGRADVLWFWEGWIPSLDAWKAISCCGRGRLVETH